MIFHSSSMWQPSIVILGNTGYQHSNTPNRAQSSLVDKECINPNPAMSHGTHILLGSETVKYLSELVEIEEIGLWYGNVID